MQTTGTYVKNLLIGTLYATLLVIFIPIVLSIVAFASWAALPDTMIDVFNYIENHKTGMRHATLFVLLLFALYRFYKSIKRAGDFKRNFKFHIVTAIYAYAMYYACAMLLLTYFFHHYERCDYYNQKLNGGIKEFRREKFKIDLCGTGGDAMQRNDQIRLEVFNANGNLLALRHFVVNWDQSFSGRSVEYFVDHLSYDDESLQEDFKKTVSMPPTILDWIRTKIPFLD